MYYREKIMKKWFNISPSGRNSFSNTQKEYGCVRREMVIQQIHNLAT